MSTVTLSAKPSGNSYVATLTYPDAGVSMCSTDTFPSIEEAIIAAALKLLSMPDRLKRMDRDIQSDTGWSYR